MALADFEARLERGVEGVFSRVFRSHGVRPIEIARKLTKEMDLSRTVGVKGETLVANSFVVSVSPSDLAVLAEIDVPLRRELVALLEQHCDESAYYLIGPLEVAVVPDESRRSGTLSVVASLKQDARERQHYLVLPAGDRVPLTGERIVLGRAPDCLIVLADPNASRQHAEVKLSGDRFEVADLHSTNGTSVNGIRIDRHQLVNGDQIVIGNTVIRFVEALV